jgi:hypothetical protein
MRSSSWIWAIFYQTLSPDPLPTDCHGSPLAASRAGAIAYLTKPVEREALFATLRKWLPNFRKN